MVVFRKLCEIARSSKVHKTESVSTTSHSRSATVSCTESAAIVDAILRGTGRCVRRTVTLFVRREG